MYLRMWQLATELCLHFALIAQEVCLLKEQDDCENMREIFPFLFWFKMYNKQTVCVLIENNKKTTKVKIIPHIVSLASLMLRQVRLTHAIS